MAALKVWILEGPEFRYIDFSKGGAVGQCFPNKYCQHVDCIESCTDCVELNHARWQFKEGVCLEVSEAGV